MIKSPKSLSKRQRTRPYIKANSQRPSSILQSTPSRASSKPRWMTPWSKAWQSNRLRTWWKKQSYKISSTASLRSKARLIQASTWSDDIN